MPTRRGFTRGDAIALLAATVVLGSIVVPIVAQVRGPDAAKTRSTANLRLHGQVLALYSNEHRGALLNPYKESPSWFMDTWKIYPLWYPDRVAYIIEADAYAYHWGPFIQDYYDDYEEREVFAAPGDTETLEEIQWLEQEDGPWVTNISYWYSPTMFYTSRRFDLADGGDSETGAIAENLERNFLADMTFPSRKVVVFEKQDFTTPDKLLFSHPESRVGMLLGDGAVSVSDNQPLYDAIALDPSLTPSGGNWADEDGLRGYRMDNQFSPNELLEDQQFLYPAFYAWTREGVRGRDLF